MWILCITFFYREESTFLLCKTTWITLENLVEKPDFSTFFAYILLFACFPHSFPRLFHLLIRKVFHNFSTLFTQLLPNFTNLISQCKIHLHISLNLLNTVHYCSVIFNSYLKGNFWRTHL